MAGEISSRNGRVNIDPVALAQRRASAGMTSDVQLSQGMLQLEAELAEQGKVIDLNQGGGNAYLVIAELMYTHKLQIQGLMFTMWGEERRNSLVGAMSRKAREDVKTYMYHNPDVFEKAGQWVGDHDCLAMARCYKVRIVVTRVIYDDQIEECIYEPEDGVKARGELHVILDRKLFWAVKSLEAFEKQAAGDDDDEVEEEEVVVKKPRSALEKVLAKYGTEDVDAKPAPAKVELATPGQREGGEKTLVGFQKVHTVSLLAGFLAGDCIGSGLSGAFACRSRPSVSTQPLSSGCTGSAGMEQSGSTWLRRCTCPGLNSSCPRRNPWRSTSGRGPRRAPGSTSALAPTMCTVTA
jgi:hypothetical protein